MGKTHRIGVLGVLVLVVLLGMLLAAGPALAAWPMWGDPPMPFGGQAPTVYTSQAIPDVWTPFISPLDPGVPTTSPYGDEVLLGWTFAGYVSPGVGPAADRLTGLYGLLRWNYVGRGNLPDTGNTHWGTAIYTSVDPTPYWPKLPPKSKWLWTGRFQGVTFLPDGLGLHSLQGTLVGCNRNLGLKAYTTSFFFMNEYPDMEQLVTHGQGWVVRTFCR